MKLPKITGVSFIADIASLLKDAVGAVGINVDLQEVELGSFIGSTLLSGNFDMAFFPNLPYDEPDRPLCLLQLARRDRDGQLDQLHQPRPSTC